jgi:hypothetical protein
MYNLVLESAMPRNDGGQVALRCDREFSVWDELLRFYSEYLEATSLGTQGVWAFRGQACVSWGLQTVLDRAKARLGLSAQDLPLMEEGILREFQRLAPAFAKGIRLPDKNEILEWFALMRHHGGPTRLLDWTSSFFVALYFAVEQAEGDCAVWALEVNWCDAQSRHSIAAGEAGFDRREDGSDQTEMRLRQVEEEEVQDPYLRDPYSFCHLFARPTPIPLVHQVNPFFISQRRAAQQGIFVAPGDVSKDFEENLRSLQTSDPAEGSHLVKICIKRSLRDEALRKLYYRNISRETLFPDLDGLAQSFHARLVLPEILVPDWRKKRSPNAFIDWEEG